jgi:hypothetical protein
VSCFNFIPPSARERFFSEEAKAEKLSWFPPKLLITDRQEKRMRRLANSDKETDRAVAASNPSTPLDRLHLMRLDDSVLVRRALVKNPTLPLDFLELMAHKDLDPGIAAYARFRLKWEFTGEEDHGQDHGTVSAAGGSSDPDDGGADESDPPR